MINFSKFSSLFSLVNYFSTEQRCKDALAETRWADGDIICPYCGGHHCAKRKDGRYRCNHCKRNFSVTVGNIFENTNISLRKWFMGMYLISSHKKGISSCQLARDIEVTQKTAWYMLQKCRSLYAQSDSIALEGEVEMDEMYLGGRETNKHASKKVENTQGRSTKTKQPIFGMVERNGKAVALAVDNCQAKTLYPIIKQFVSDNAHLFTDELNAYNGLEKEGYKHDVINHGNKEYSNLNGIYTNTIEGFWGQFKRMVFGIYHHVSKKYIQRYIDEATMRWNTRKASETTRFQMMFEASIGVFDYSMVRMENNQVILPNVPLTNSIVELVG